MALWINRSLVQAPRNGTTSHTISFTAATAGNLLVLVMEGAVTHTVPTGWTRQAQALNNTELSVYTKTATAGESSFSTTHNGSDYPVGAVVYEFAAGSTWSGAVSNINGALGGVNPTLSGLTGTNLVFGAVAVTVADTFLPSTVWSGVTGLVEDSDVSVAHTTTDGYGLSLAYVEDYTGTSFAPTGTVTKGGVATTKEMLTFAVKVATTAPPATTATPTSIASGTVAAAPTITATATVTPDPVLSGVAVGDPSLGSPSSATGTAAFIDGAQAANTGATSFAVPVPSSGGPLQAGDLIIADWSWDVTSATPVGRTLPSGWTSLTGVITTTTTFVQGEAAYHIVTAGEAGTTPSWVVQNGAAYDGNVAVSRFRGVDPVTPFAVASPFYAITVQNTGTTTKVAPAVVTTAANALRVTGMGIRNGSGSITVPSGYSMGGNAFLGTGRTTALAHSTQATAGSSGTATWTHATSSVGYAWMTALNPAVAAPAVTVSPGSVASAGSLGAPALTPGPVSVSPSGVASAVALGPPQLSGSGLPLLTVVTPNAIGSGGSAGSPGISTAVTVSPGSVPYYVAPGTPTVRTRIKRLRFTPPTVVRTVPIAGGLRAQLLYGVTLYRLNGQWVEDQAPLPEDLIGADLIYWGGCVYNLDDAAVAALTAAGYGDRIETIFEEIL